MQHDEAVGHFNARNRGVGIELERLGKHLLANVFFRAVGKAAEHRAHRVDDLGVVRAQGNVGIGVFWDELDGGIERVFDLGADAFFERFDNRDALRVTAERERVQVERIGVFGVALLLLFGTRGGVFKNLQFLFLVFFKVGAVDARGLVGGIDA